MGVTTDYALTHIRRVGTGKGPAVQTVRAHVCKSLYPELMQQVMGTQERLTLIEGVVASVQSSGTQVKGVHLEDGTRLACRSVVLTTGTFLNGLCHEGRKKTVAARHGDKASVSLGAFLLDLGIHMRRFKTGTTPRVRKSSIDFTQTPELGSDADAGPVSFAHDRIYPQGELLPCWQTRTTQATHDLIHSNLHESAMYSGEIEGIGPRYCPSIEDKIVRFADKTSHPIFLEQEEWHGESMYVQGVSTSLPADVQIAFLRTIPGLEEVEMLRPGYAVEYDMADPLQLTPQLMSKLMDGLFLAGQVNGTSGYEEAAGQGIVAGINAALFARDEGMLDFPRDNSFIGVMIDDLVTKGVDDPYRMLTARAEHRLLLRHDNADVRLTPIARDLGLCSDARWEKLSRKGEEIERGMAHLENTFVMPMQSNFLLDAATAAVDSKISLFELLRRPEMNLDRVERLTVCCDLPWTVSKDVKVREQIELAAAYAGYIQRQERLAGQARKLDQMKIPVGFDFGSLSLSHESQEKLTRVQPLTVGQASRVPGVRPSDIALIIGHLKRYRAVCV